VQSRNATVSRVGGPPVGASRPALSGVAPVAGGDPNAAFRERVDEGAVHVEGHERRVCERGRGGEVFHRRVDVGSGAMPVGCQKARTDENHDRAMLAIRDGVEQGSKAGNALTDLQLQTSRERSGLPEHASSAIAKRTDSILCRIQCLLIPGCDVYDFRHRQVVLT
jgi:hypothetical protein